MRLSEKTTAYTAMACTSVLAGMIACNQTLAVLLTDQLCGALKHDASDFALDLEDSVIVIAPLIPWSIAGGVPLAAVGATTSAIPLACYLYLLPLWRLVTSRKRRTS
jgi:NhaC family Na+:H+ antiporter